MIIKIPLFLLILILINFSASADEIDCTKFTKFSAKYIECSAKKLKLKTNEKVKTGKEKFKKFKESKTLSDLIKD